MAGLAPDFLRVANRVRSVAAMSHDHALARIRFEPDDTPYPFISMVPQNVTEDLLAQALERKGAEVEYNTRFFSMNESLDVVSVVIEKDGKQEQIRARYVVGCDGAHSAVRRSLGITLDGGEYDMPFMLADIETNQDLPADELQLCSSAHGPIAIFPMSATRRRVVATVGRTEGEAPTWNSLNVSSGNARPRLFRQASFTGAAIFGFTIVMPFNCGPVECFSLAMQHNL